MRPPRFRRALVASALAGQRGRAATLEDPPALPLRRAAPDAVVDAVVERVLQAGFLHRARRADPARDLDTHTVAREEDRRWVLPAVAQSHPVGVHQSSVSPVYTVQAANWFHG